MRRILARFSIFASLLLLISFVVSGCGDSQTQAKGAGLPHPATSEQMPDMDGAYGTLPCPDAKQVESPAQAFRALGGEAFESAAQNASASGDMVPSAMGALNQSWVCQKSYSAVLVTSNGSRVVLAPLGNMDVSGYFKEFLAHDPGSVVQLGDRPVLITPGDGIKQDNLDGWPEPGRGTAQFALGKLWVIVLGNHLLSPDQMIASAAQMIGVRPETAVDVSNKWGGTPVS